MAVHDVLAAVVPDRDMVVCGDVRRTFGEVADRSRGLAAFFAGRGLGVRRERGGLDRWENGQDTVAVTFHLRGEPAQPGSILAISVTTTSDAEHVSATAFGRTATLVRENRERKRGYVGDWII